jgi:hypothetical protein
LRRAVAAEWFSVASFAKWLAVRTFFSFLIWAVAVEWLSIASVAKWLAVRTFFSFLIWAVAAEWLSFASVAEWLSIAVGFTFAIVCHNTFSFSETTDAILSFLDGWFITKCFFFAETTTVIGLFWSF